MGCPLPGIYDMLIFTFLAIAVTIPKEKEGNWPPSRWHDDGESIRLDVSHANMQDFSPRLFPKLENTSHHAKHRKIPNNLRIHPEEDDEKKTRWQVMRTKHESQAIKDPRGESESNEYQQEGIES